MATITYALTAAAVALVGIIAAELTPIESAPEQAMAFEAPQPVPAAPPPLSDPRDQNASRALIALTRPLFNPDRHPVAPPSDAVSTALAPSLPRLTGTLVSPGHKRAVFATGDKPTVMVEGSRIDAWTVQEISAGTVILAGPDGPHVLHLSFATGDTTHKTRVVELPLSIRPVRTHSRTEVVASK